MNEIHLCINLTIEELSEYTDTGQSGGGGGRGVRKHVTPTKSREQFRSLSQFLLTCTRKQYTENSLSKTL
jgi:hypothetical protein